MDKVGVGDGRRIKNSSRNACNGNKTEDEVETQQGDKLCPVKLPATIFPLNDRMCLCEVSSE